MDTRCGGSWRSARVRVSGVAGCPSREAFRSEPASVASLLSRRSITVGAAVGAAVLLEIEGRLRVGRWLPFQATQVLAPPAGSGVGAAACSGSSAQTIERAGSSRSSSTTPRLVCCFKSLVALRADSSGRGRFAWAGTSAELGRSPCAVPDRGRPLTSGRLVAAVTARPPRACRRWRRPRWWSRATAGSHGISGLEGPQRSLGSRRVELMTR